MPDVKPGRYIRVAGFMYTYDAFKNGSPRSRDGMKAGALVKLIEALAAGESGVPHAMDRSDYTDPNDVIEAFEFWEKKLSSL